MDKNVKNPLQLDTSTFQNPLQDFSFAEILGFSRARADQIAEKRKRERIVSPRYGQPRAFGSPQHIAFIARSYLQHCAAMNTIPSMTELAICCGCCRDTLMAYARGEYDVKGISSQNYSAVMKVVVEYVISAWERRLLHPHVAGPIFWLKNHGWSDQVQVTGADSGPIQVSFIATSPHFANTPKNKEIEVT